MRWLAVEPSARRRGVGTALIAAIRDAARAAGCTAVTHTAVAASDGANGLAAAAGAEPGLVMEQNRLDVGDVPAGLLDHWIERAGERAHDYSLVCWQNECPEEFLDRIAKAYEIMNTAPQDPGEEPLRVTPERVRAGHRMHAARGDGFHTTVLHEPAGQLVALTELRQVRFRPWHADQGDTCTDPAHRDRGLGRWIKAHNLAWLLHDHPEVGEVDTWNADVNEPMLAINRAMGFRLARTWRNWRLPV
jgi:GNAT superfamily N-acetyltransferase